ncbi:assembly of actin patch protein [Talaromyces marneffei ATCC 18224]|uniref:SH3 domain protein n=1 Tax=Talaromyces marneffei (strain ATCC 18224 / CBS 334.59 / QM 7333) TaxID=441960 RepID=B6QP81_TALMQ|nr:SH3 domain protein [Talaromyces marneffei ATCC 18224]EEA20943.1 SH3 domain protein [Talaromyces marneffei ATCC 18224]
MSGPPFTVKALFDYTSEHEDDLHFSIGQVITVTAVEDADWYYGEYNDDAGSKQEGIFPRNFVERFEPTAPPRPSRPVKAKKEADPVPPPAQPAAVETPAAKEMGEEPVQGEEPEPASTVEPPQEKSVPLPSPPPPAPVVNPVVPPVVSQPPKQPQPEPSPAPAAKASPPVVSSKPSSNAFRDRIAAFNKPAAPPIAPFKPGGASVNSFIKKPFVAPPPSKNAYVPIPREQLPPKAYRREEDPEITNREPPVSEHSLPSPPSEPSQDEDQPKPTSLKERIALLQKQQLEQASRLAEAAQKKEKAKKPPKKRTDFQEAPPVPAAAESPELEHTDIETPRGERPSFEGEGGEDVKPARLGSPPLPSRELTSDTNDADYSGAADTEDAEETSTSREDADERPRAQKHAVHEQQTDDGDNEEAAAEDDEEEEEEEVDPEVRRRMELRERMAKMSGGMGMMGMFGGGGMGIPPRKPKVADDAGRQAEELEAPRSPLHAPPVPIMALPGMNVQRPPPVSSPKEVEKEDEHEDMPITQLHSADELPDVEDVVEEHDIAPRKSIDRAPPPPPQERSVPPLPFAESRPPPPPIPGSQPAPPPAPESRPAAPASRPPTSPSPGSESDDELSNHTNKMSLDSTLTQAAPSSPPPPPRRSSTYDSIRSATMSEKRFSRGPPPIPTNTPQAPSSPPQARPPPPPPPGALSRQTTSDSRHSIIQSPISRDQGIQDETTEYEADYDTDIAPTAKHKDALKSHGREPSIEDGGDELSPQSPRALPPLLPTAPRAVPPPPPGHPPSKRASMDIPRSAPPPPPPVRDLTTEEEEEEDDGDEYDPYRYDSGRPNIPPPLPSNPPPPPREEYNDEDDSPVSLPQAAPPPPPPERTVAPPPPPHEKSVPPPPPTTEAPRSRQSLDISRAMANTRRSMDISRPSTDMGYIATDVDLAESTFWWTQPNIPPPVFQNRKDLLFEIEESTSSKRGGKTTVSKDVYVLFADYSQTVINVRFDAKNPSDVTFEQRQEAPPSKLRQDQLETAHEKFGSKISAAANSVQNTTVGDGTPYGLIQHLLSPLSDVLLPVGTRAYGALVYANLANASVQQNDEIRAGDIISFRNAKFQGHKGGLHQKYSAEVGKPDHVGVIVDWDGTKKKIHAWEQGRESKKVKPESFKLGDLKSGEVKVWRVMPRSWIGWNDDK